MKKLLLLTSLFLLTLNGFALAEFVDNGDGTITDTTSALMWQKTSACQYSWADAILYCDELRFAGYTDWKLPNIELLESIVNYDYEPTIDPIFYCVSWPYWSSTESNGQSDKAWGISFDNGTPLLLPVQGTYCIRCVRGTTTPPNCATVDKDLNITIPCLRYGGKLWKVKLKFYSDPLLPAGLYWKFESMAEK